MKNTAIVAKEPSSITYYCQALFVCGSAEV